MPTNKKIRLDQLLFDRALVKSRTDAQRLIRLGKVLVTNEKIEKPGTKVPVDSPIRLLGNKCPYVSRGGLKLAEALSQFQIDVTDCIAADLGASTGGFTDCLLQHGAHKVYAIDVGYGQLAYSLQTDPRVVVMDRTNCRHLTQIDLGEPVDLVVGDLSFISIQTVFPAIQSLIKKEGCIVLLIKPQFEIGKGRVGKNGIIRNPEDHIEVLWNTLDFFGRTPWHAKGIIPSPIKGKSGNLEFLIHLVPYQPELCLNPEQVRQMVFKVHEEWIGIRND